MTIGLLLATMFVITSLFIQPAAATEAIPEPSDIINISVDEAYAMIESNDLDNLVIIDVRPSCEYGIGHLYNSISLPYEEMELGINELQIAEDYPIIVYCKSGYTSQLASELLASLGFSMIYNMEGGIIAWMEAGYQIYTTYHHATVDVIHGKLVFQIEPLLLYQAGVVPCTQCQQDQDGEYSPATNIQSTVLEQDDYHIVYLVTYDVDGVEYSYTVTNTLLWDYNKNQGNVHRTASLASVEIAGEASYQKFFTLAYYAECEEYNFTTYTYIRPSDQESYDTAFTIVDYEPADKSGDISLELVDFNTSITLSEHYRILGKVAAKIGKEYQKSGDESLTVFAQRYKSIEQETKYLSKLVKKQIPEYDKEILTSSAIIMDQDWLLCLGNILACLAAILTTPEVLAACPLCLQVVTCIPACAAVFTVWWCIGCIAAGFIGCLICAGGIAALAISCYEAGHCLGLW